MLSTLVMSMTVFSVGYGQRYRCETKPRRGLTWRCFEVFNCLSNKGTLLVWKRNVLKFWFMLVLALYQQTVTVWSKSCSGDKVKVGDVLGHLTQIKSAMDIGGYHLQIQPITLNIDPGWVSVWRVYDRNENLINPLNENGRVMFVCLLDGFTEENQNERQLDFRVCYNRENEMSLIMNYGLGADDSKFVLSVMKL